MAIIYGCPPGEAWLGTILRPCIRLDGLGNVVATNNAKTLMVNKNSIIFSHSNLLLVQVSLQVFSMWGPSIPG